MEAKGAERSPTNSGEKKSAKGGPDEFRKVYGPYEIVKV